MKVMYCVDGEDRQSMDLDVITIIPWDGNPEMAMIYGGNWSKPVMWKDIRYIGEG